jgi:hypothetical protein
MITPVCSLLPYWSYQCKNTKMEWEKSNAVVETNCISFWRWTTENLCGNHSHRSKIYSKYVSWGYDSGINNLLLIKPTTQLSLLCDDWKSYLRGSSSAERSNQTEEQDVLYTVRTKLQKAEPIQANQIWDIFFNHHTCNQQPAAFESSTEVCLYKGYWDRPVWLVHVIYWSLFTLDMFRPSGHQYF